MYFCPHCEHTLRVRDIDPLFSCPGCNKPLQSTQKRSAMIVILMFVMFALFGGPASLLYLCVNLKCILGIILFGIVLLILFYLYLIRVAPAEDTDV